MSYSFVDSFRAEPGWNILVLLFLSFFCGFLFCLLCLIFLFSALEWPYGCPAITLIKTASYLDSCHNIHIIAPEV
jgi:hypothetical protein